MYIEAFIFAFYLIASLHVSWYTQAMRTIQEGIVLFVNLSIEIFRGLGSLILFMQV